MRKLNLFGIALAFAVSAGAQANQATPGAQSTEDIKSLTTESKPNDIDEQITNARMRADSGSKNKYSMSVSLAYQGGTVEQPFGRERPEIYGDPETRSLTDISGGISARYRMTPNDSFTLGGALAILTPFSGSFADAEERTELNNPEIAYVRTFKLGKTQNNFRTWLTYGTQESWELQGLLTRVGISHTVLTTLEAAPLTLGVTPQVVRLNYANEVAAPRNAYAVGLFPFLEYAFNSTYSFRTVFGYFNWRMVDEQNRDGFKSVRANSYQSMGLGISVTRDVYLYPNIQFLPEDAAIDKTNVALSTTINI